MRAASPIRSPLALVLVLVLALLLLCAPTGLWAAGGAYAAAATPRTTLPAVEGQVMCVTCKIPLTVAQSPQASRERVYIQGLIDEGRTLPQIKRALVFQYGPAVLALPASHGFDLIVYVVPAVVALLLLATLAVLLPRWRRRARGAQAARAAEEVPAHVALNPTDAARLQADMARFD
jgi:cytochrome c-type biogenesis protein CcmH